MKIRNTHKRTRAKYTWVMVITAIMLCFPAKDIYAQKDKYDGNTVKDRHKEKFKTALGIEYTWPFYSFSLKYAFTQHSVVDVVVSPFGGNNGISFYGARYIYRCNFHQLDFISDDAVGYPYLFAGAGLLKWSYNSYYNYSASSAAYYFGAGYEVILAKHFGISAEAGYGQLSTLGDLAVTAFTYDGEIHYYFKSNSHKK